MTPSQIVEALNALSEDDLHFYAEDGGYELLFNREGWWWKFGNTISRHIYHTKREALLHILFISAKKLK